MPIGRKGPSRETAFHASPSAFDCLDARLFFRYQTLRRQRRIDVLLAEGGHLYLADNPLDLWGSKRSISHGELRSTIEELETIEAAA